MPDPQVAVTHYCERAGPGFWSEPVNALTNLAFVAAAAAIAVALRRSHQSPWTIWDLWLLAGLVAVVGVGSFLWHTLATPWSEAADVVPIVLFIDVFLVSFLVRIGRCALPAVAGWFLAFQALNYAVFRIFPPDALNASVFYLPTWAALWSIVAYCWAMESSGRLLMLGAGLVFTLSLTLRTLDVALCTAWPLGTHFVWHLLNGVTLYLVTVALIPGRRAERIPGQCDQ